MLVVATACWSVSFPIMRAWHLYLAQKWQAWNSWTVSGIIVGVRFLICAAVVGAFCILRRCLPSRLELEQGAALGTWGAAGMLLQIDGLAHTDASISAFLTQMYVVYIPLWQTITYRCLPNWSVTISIVAAILGVGLLSRIQLQNLRIGRGEAETLLAAVMFAGQILWLTHPRYRMCRWQPMSMVMFAVTGMIGLGASLIIDPEGCRSLSMACASLFSICCLLVLVFVSTLGGYLLMNRWQPLVDPMRASLIYCMEPIFASLLVLFLPSWLSFVGGIDYPNERLSWRLLAGGMFIILANVLVSMQRGGGLAMKRKKAATRPE